MNTEKRNDEIDLIELFLNIYIFFKKHFWLLFISAFIGAGLGYSTKFFAKKHYESTMLVNSYTTSSDLIIQYINTIQSLLDDNNLALLSKKMEIDSSKLVVLKKISAEKALDEKKEEELGFLIIKAETIDNRLFENLGTGILNFLSKEPYIQNDIEIFKENNLNIISRIDEEIRKIEILQELNLRESSNKGDVNIYNSQRSFQNEILELLKEKQTREKSLKFAVPFRLIQDFTIFQKPVKKTVTYTLTGGFLFGFLALFYLIFRNINKNIKEKGLD